MWGCYEQSDVASVWGWRKYRLVLAWLSLCNRFCRDKITQADGPVVSLTTHGDRVHRVFLAIESIARGGLKPSRLILWLDEEDVYKNPPITLERLRRRGLEIRLSRNYGPHTKYFPALSLTDLLDKPLVTADDDICYPKYWLAGLVKAFVEYPDVINCYRAHRISLSDDGVSDYRDWNACASDLPSYLNFATGVSGVIYPPAFLSEVKSAGDDFMQICPKADDVWLHALAVRRSVKVRQISPRSVHFPIIPNTQQDALMSVNVCAGLNDQQIRATYINADLEKMRLE